MRERVLIPEKMDDPALEAESHLQALRGLRRINAWTGNARRIWNDLLPLARRRTPLRVLDVATGAADIPIRLCRYALAAGVPLEMQACDVSPRALAFAAQACAEAKMRVDLFQHDVVREPIPDQYDVVMCSQFLHHLSTDDAAAVLRRLKEAALQRVLVVDLERGYVNWCQVWIATRLLSRSPVVHFDGPQSVRAAFSLAEITRLAAAAGFARFYARRIWPCRFVLCGDVVAHA